MLRGSKDQTTGQNYLKVLFYRHTVFCYDLIIKKPTEIDIRIFFFGGNIIRPGCFYGYIQVG